MLSSINELISIEILIWLLPIIFIIHDGEEIVTVERFMRANKDRPELARESRMMNWDKNITLQFAFAVLLLGSLLLLITIYAAKGLDSEGELSMLYVGAVGVILLDGIKHIGISIALKMYTPGLLTAALAEVPFGVYILYRLFDAAEIDILKILLGTGIALPLTIFMVWFGLTIGRWIAPYRPGNIREL